MKEGPLLQFSGDLSGQNMFGGAVICIAKKLLQKWVEQLDSWAAILSQLGYICPLHNDIKLTAKDESWLG